MLGGKEGASFYHFTPVLGNTLLIECILIHAPVFKMSLSACRRLTFLQVRPGRHSITGQERKTNKHLCIFILGARRNCLLLS